MSRPADWTVGLVVFFSLCLLAVAAFAHDWYSGQSTSPDHPDYPGWSCCNGDAVTGDCKPVRAWQTEAGGWRFRYVDGTEWDVPDYAMRPDETNGEPFQASACVYKGKVMCFWRKAAGG